MLLRAALIQSGIVANVIIAGEDYNPPDGFVMVALPSESGVSIGWSYDADTGQFSEPEPPAPSTIRTKRQFLRLLTDDEQDAIEDSTLQPVRRAWREFFAAEYIDLADPDTTHFIGGLVMAGLLSEQRMSDIIAGVEL